MLPRVCIIVVTYNGRQFLPDCLSSLHAVDYPVGGWTIVVVDNGSSDGSTEYVAANFPTAVVIRQTQNIGFAAGNNVGLRHALAHNFDYAYLLNQDTVVQPDFLRQVVAIAQAEPDVAAVQSKLLLHGTSLINSWGNAIHYLGFGYAGGHRQSDQQLSVRDIAYASGAAVLLRCATLRSVGPLDETLFMYHEDLELGWRLWLAGYRCVLAPASVVYHKYEFSRSIKKYYWMERNRCLVLLTHYRFATLLVIWPAILLVDAGLLLQSVRGGYFLQVMSAHLYFFNPVTWSKIWRRRRSVQKLRRRPDREIITRFASQIKFQDLPETAIIRLGNAIMASYWRMVRPMIRW